MISADQTSSSKIMVDLAQRVYNHNYKLDPIVRSLLDTDVYKLLMQQLIVQKHPTIDATFSVINRTTRVRLADIIDENELRAQLDHARMLRFDERELIWLAGNTFYGIKQIFTPAYVEYLRKFRLPPYALARVDGQYELAFAGRWADSTLWEIPALSIVNELRSRAAMRRMGRFELDVLYARAKSRLWDKIDRLQDLKAHGGLMVGDFGTRRRHGFLWQRWCNEALREGLGEAYIGTSNVLLAMELGVSAIGTNAHELPMAYAALAASRDDDAALRTAPYRVLDDWKDVYQGNLLILLPDAYGTKRFLADAPAGIETWTGARPDSKPPIEGGDELIDWWKSRGQDPREKLLILSDGMDVDTIDKAYWHFRHRIKVSFGWGTNLTNDFRKCAPSKTTELDAISTVCKVVEVDGQPAVKLSDNPSKATGPKPEIERYLGIFGNAGMRATDVRV